GYSLVSAQTDADLSSYHKTTSITTPLHKETEETARFWSFQYPHSSPSAWVLFAGGLCSFNNHFSLNGAMESNPNLAFDHCQSIPLFYSPGYPGTRQARTGA